jgi:hypothetical protein
MQFFIYKFNSSLEALFRSLRFCKDKLRETSGVKGLATHWLAYLPGWDSHPFDYTTLLGHTSVVSPEFNRNICHYFLLICLVFFSTITNSTKEITIVKIPNGANGDLKDRKNKLKKIMNMIAKTAYIARGILRHKKKAK